MKWNELKENKTLLGLVALVLAVGLAVGLLAWSVMGIVERSAKIKETQAALEASYQELNYLQSLAQNSKETMAQLERYQQLLPKDLNQNDLLLQLQTLCNEYGVTASLISFGEKTAAYNLNVLPMELTLQGGYEKVMPLLEELRFGQRLVSVNKLAITSRKANDLDVQASVAVYYR